MVVERSRNARNGKSEISSFSKAVVLPEILYSFEIANARSHLARLFNLPEPAELMFMKPFRPNFFMRACRLFALLFLPFLFSGCFKTKPDPYVYVPPRAINTFRPLPAYAAPWFDSIMGSTYHGKNILATTPGGLSESMTISIDTTSDKDWNSIGDKYYFQKATFSYRSSIYGNDFSFTKKYEHYGFNNDTTTYSWNSCFVVTCDNDYLRYFADSGSTRYWGIYGNTNDRFPLWGLEWKGKRTYGNKTYSDVYRSGEMLNGYYKEFIFDKHWGLLQFTSNDSLTWTLHYE